MNIGNCSKANAKEIIEVGIGEDFICPECGGQLVEVKKINVLPYIIGGVVVALVVAELFGDLRLLMTLRRKKKLLLNRIR